MNFSEYQERAKETANYPTLGHPVIYPVLGLAGEAGEVAEKIKKLFRDKEGEMTGEFKIAIIKELGDVLWYVAAIATELRLDLDAIAQTNIVKLSLRLKNNTINGEGDNR